MDPSRAATLLDSSASAGAPAVEPIQITRGARPPGNVPKRSHRTSNGGRAKSRDNSELESRSLLVGYFADELQRDVRRVVVDPCDAWLASSSNPPFELIAHCPNLRPRIVSNVSRNKQPHRRRPQRKAFLALVPIGVGRRVEEHAADHIECREGGKRLHQLAIAGKAECPHPRRSR